MRFKLFLFFILFLSSAGFVGAQAPPAAAADRATEEERIRRLAGLGKVWGAVKYFHPFLAYREIDWDRALVEAIPRVNAADSPREYEAAVNSMLAALGDGYTRARFVGAEKHLTENPKRATGPKKPVRLEDGVLTIDAAVVAEAIWKENESQGEFLDKAGELLPRAKSVLIDLRVGERPNEEILLYLDFLRDFLISALDRNVPLASARYRLHSGYPAQTFAFSGEYYSGMTTLTPVTLAGNSRAKTPPIVFLVDENSRQMEVVGGLQAAKLAFVIQEQGGTGGGEPGVARARIKLPDDIEVEMRTAEFVNPDGTIGFAADLVAPKNEGRQTALRLLAENKFVSNRAKGAAALAPPVSGKDKPYAEMEFPGAEYRLLALFRFWNVINYFFPYKDLTGADWDELLPRYIPKFESNKDAIEYQLTVRELSTETRDSHTYVRNARALDAKIGMFTAPVLLRYVENQTVVAKVMDEKLPLKVGDVVLRIDGEPVEKRREFLSRITAASTPQALTEVVHWNLLRGQKDSPAKLTVRGGGGGETREAEVARTLPRQSAQLYEASLRTTPVVSVSPGGFGYVDLERLTVAEVDKMFETIKNTPATIFDMRGYPQGTAWEIAQRLTAKKSPVGALFSRPNPTAVNFLDAEVSAPDFAFAQKLPAAKGGVYGGRVVMLIDETAISQAEHTALFFEAARPDIVFIGTPTKGADGDITDVILPGNVAVSFSGHSVRHADGRQLQRVGIQPHVRVEPTVRGIAGGRDEILEAAVKYLQSTAPRQ